MSKKIWYICNQETKATSGARRVQIFNASDSYAPTDKKELAVFAKPESAKAFLRNAIGAHYLFESLGDEDLDRIIDCMRPSFAATNEVTFYKIEMFKKYFCSHVLLCMICMYR